MRRPVAEGAGGDAKHNPEGGNGAKSQNGTGSKTVITEVGPGRDRHSPDRIRTCGLIIRRTRGSAGVGLVGLDRSWSDEHLDTLVSKFLHAASERLSGGQGRVDERHHDDGKPKTDGFGE